jgi:hypothetical protein
MFEPQIFIPVWIDKIEITSSQLLGYAGNMIGVTATSLFLYLLRLPARDFFLGFFNYKQESPISNNPNGATPRGGNDTNGTDDARGINRADAEAALDRINFQTLVRNFAWFFVFVISFLVSCGIALLSLAHNADIDKYASLYFDKTDVLVQDRSPRKILVLVKEYDGFSNFRVFINGYRVFGSGTHCALNFQCRPRGDLLSRKRYDEYRSIDYKGFSTYRLNEMFELPYAIDISRLLLPSDDKHQNFIDIYSENSGTGGCGLAIALAEISQNGAIAEKELARFQNEKKRDHLHRVCKKPIRIQLKLTDDQHASLEGSSSFLDWAVARRRSTVCSYQHHDLVGCTQTSVMP